MFTMHGRTNEDTEQVYLGFKKNRLIMTSYNSKKIYNRQPQIWLGIFAML